METFVRVGLSTSGHACGERSNGTVTCWGDSYVSALQPTGTWVEWETYAQRFCGRRADGSVSCLSVDPPELLSAHPGGTFSDVSLGLQPRVRCAHGGWRGAVLG